MRIVILAAGAGSRLKPITNRIPKILVQTGKHTAFHEMIDFWSHHARDVTVIVHSDHAALIRAQFDLFFANSEIKLTIATVDEQAGSAHAISSACRGYSGPILFQWCDVVLRGWDKWRFDFDQNREVCVMTSNDIPCRYRCKGSKIKQVKGATGNVFGMYYIANYRDDFTYALGADFVESLEQFGKISSFEVPENSVFDFGDAEKYAAIHAANKDKSREFNTLKIEGDIVTKEAINPQGQVIITKEKAWYDRALSLGANERGLVLTPLGSTDRNVLKLPRVRGCSIFEKFPSMTPEDQSACLDSALGAIHGIHVLSRKIVSPEIIRRDIIAESQTKLINRCAKIRATIDSFGPIHRVNGIDILPLDGAVEFLTRELLAANSRTTTYNFIHGDSQFSNLMLGEEGIVAIDPRGYFGETEFYGLPAYDRAKILYSLTGYDQFNYSTTFHINSIEDGEITFDMPKSGIHPDVTSGLGDKFTRDEFIWLAVIWIGLGEYIKNNPVKSVCAYYHGLAIASSLHESN